MTNYFTLTTTAANAIDNVTIYGWSVYDPTDVLRLINAHAKYPYSLTFSYERTEGVESLCLKQVLDALDEMVLHQKEVIYKDIYDHTAGLSVMCTTAYEEDGYWHIDLSGKEFKKLCVDRTAMLDENERVGRVMSFLFKHNCEFEYEGSRAKLRIPIHDLSNRNLSIHGSNKYYRIPTKYLTKEIVLECDVYSVLKEEKVVEVKPINQ